MWSETYIFWAVCIFRFVNCCLVQTSFVPDEYWQSLEPAHRLVFGYGDLPWEWTESLRSYLYPLVFAVIYQVLAIFHLDTRFLIVHLPRLAQTFLAAVADLYLYKFSKKLYGEKAALWTLVCYWLNWFVFFCSSRTLTNTVEAQLTIIALYYYPWPSQYLFEGKNGYSNRSTPVYLSIVALSTILRPTSAVFWLPFVLWHFYRVPGRLRFIFSTVLPSSLSVLLFSIIVDRLFYGYWTLTLWRFLNFNVLRGGSAFFGVHPWHWYFTNGIPTVILTHIMPVVAGIYKTKDRTMLWFCLFYVFVHSLLAHKELRFLLPIVAPLCTYAGRYVDQIVNETPPISCAHHSHDHNLVDYHRDEDEPSTSVSIQDYTSKASKRAQSIIAFLFVTNIPLIVYTGLVHQRGVLDVVKYLHDEATMHSPKTEVNAWFLTPCYTSPFYSHAHVRISMRMLRCDPNLLEEPDYLDEADRFHMDPSSWIDTEFSNLGYSTPTHVVMYDWLWSKIGRMKLEALGYRRCQQFFNTDFPQSERQSKYLVVACKMA